MTTNPELTTTTAACPPVPLNWEPWETWGTAARWTPHNGWQFPVDDEND